MGTGPHGRKYLLPRPSREEVEFVLWRMIFGLRMREEEARIDEKERKKEWLKKERVMKDWEHSLEVRERRVGQHDEGLANLMKDLRIREGEVEEKDNEIRVLRTELEERVVTAREEHKREI